MWSSSTSPTTPSASSKPSRNTAKARRSSRKNQTPSACLKLHADILAAGVFTQQDAADFEHCSSEPAPTPKYNHLSTTCGHAFRQNSRTRKSAKQFVYLLARFVKSVHFFTCFFTYAPTINEFATFAEYVGPQLIKARKRVRPDAAYPPDRRHQSSSGISRRVTGGGPVKIKTRQRQERQRPAAQESVCAGHDQRRFRNKFDNQRRRSTLHQTSHRRKGSRPRDPKYCHRTQRRLQSSSTARTAAKSTARFRWPTTIADAMRSFPTSNTPTRAASSTSWPSPSSNTTSQHDRSDQQRATRRSTALGAAQWVIRYVCSPTVFFALVMVRASFLQGAKSGWMKARQLLICVAARLPRIWAKYPSFAGTSE